MTYCQLCDSTFHNDTSLTTAAAVADDSSSLQSQPPPISFASHFRRALYAPAAVNETDASSPQSADQDDILRHELKLRDNASSAEIIQLVAAQSDKHKQKQKQHKQHSEFANLSLAEFEFQQAQLIDHMMTMQQQQSQQPPDASAAAATAAVLSHEQQSMPLFDASFKEPVNAQQWHDAQQVTNDLQSHQSTSVGATATAAPLNESQSSAINSDDDVAALASHNSDTNALSYSFNGAFDSPAMAQIQDLLLSSSSSQQLQLQLQQNASLKTQSINKRPMSSSSQPRKSAVKSAVGSLQSTHRTATTTMPIDASESDEKQNNKTAAVNASIRVSSASSTQQRPASRLKQPSPSVLHQFFAQSSDKTNKSQNHTAVSPIKRRPASHKDSSTSSMSTTTTTTHRQSWHALTPEQHSDTCNQFEQRLSALRFEYAELLRVKKLNGTRLVQFDKSISEFKKQQYSLLRQQHQHPQQSFNNSSNPTQQQQSNTSICHSASALMQRLSGPQRAAHRLAASRAADAELEQKQGGGGGSFSLHNSNAATVGSSGWTDSADSEDALDEQLQQVTSEVTRYELECCTMQTKLETMQAEFQLISQLQQQLSQLVQEKMKLQAVRLHNEKQYELERIRAEQQVGDAKFQIQSLHEQAKEIKDRTMIVQQEEQSVQHELHQAEQQYRDLQRQIDELTMKYGITSRRHGRH